MRWRRLPVRVVTFLVALTILFAGWGLSRLKTSGLADRLAAQASALTGNALPRPVQAPPILPGTLGEHADAALRQLDQLLAVADDVDLCRAVREGDAPADQMSPICRRELDRALPALQQLLAATHAEHPELPDRYLALTSAADGPPRWATLGYAARLAALRIRQLLEARDGAAALATCVDMLSLGRDVADRTGMNGREESIGIFEVGFRPCAAALNAAPAANQRAAFVSFSAIAHGLEPLAQTLHTWATLHLLEGFGRFLGPRVAKLPPKARQIALQGGAHRPLSAWEVFELKDFWHRSEDRMEGIVAAAQLPPPARFDRLHELTRSDQSFNRLARHAFPDLRPLAEADERCREEVELFAYGAWILAEHARTGDWKSPSALPELAPADPLVSLERTGNSARLERSGAPRGQLVLELAQPAAASGR